MSDAKTVVLNLRLSPSIKAALDQRAAAERRPVSAMAALLIEEALTRPRLAHAAPLGEMKAPMATDVTTRFRPPKKKRRAP